MNNSLNVKRMVGIASLAAIVAVLQILSSVIKFGQFSITLALIPLVVGAIVYGPRGGGFLGFVMGFIILMMDAHAFYVINPLATIFLCLIKSTGAGIFAGLIYKVFAKKNNSLGVILASISAPLVNTGIFAIGCVLMFFPTLQEWANGSSAIGYLFLGMIGINFVIEFVINSVLAPTVIYIVKIIKSNFLNEENINELE